MNGPMARRAEDAKLFRFERKFAVPDLDLATVRAAIQGNPAGFRPLYHPRQVNNLYLDTPDRESWWENVAGSSVRRVKVRIRWYGEQNTPGSTSTLELKIRRELLNRKESFRVETQALAPSFGPQQVRAMLRGADMQPALKHELLRLEPALLNSYRREYHLSADGRFRLTIDSCLQFRTPGPRGPGPASRWLTIEGIVVELKYAQADDEGSRAITQHFPFRLTRNSKYVTGIDLNAEGFAQ